MAIAASALVFAYGPEIRSFLGSGLAEKLAADGPVIAIAAAPQSAELLRHDFPIITLTLTLTLTRQDNPAWERTMRGYITSIVERRLESQGASKWRHQIPGRSRKVAWRESIKSLLSADMPLRVLSAIEHLLSAMIPVDDELKRSLQAHGVTQLFYSAYNDERTNWIVRTAQSLGIKTIAIPNSWKDVYVRPRISPQPSELHVWDEQTRALFLSLNPDLSEHVVKVKPSLHLAAVVRQKGKMDREVFCRRFGLEAQRPFICYTTAAQKAVVDEEKTVRALAESLRDVGGSKIQLLVRVNPMEIGTRFEDALSDIPDVAIQRPLWEWLPGEDWCAASAQDTLEWASTLAHMHLNVSVPSTVTLEAIEFGKQVLNVGFDSRIDIQPDASVLRYWHASFYRRFHDHPDVQLIKNLNDLVTAIDESLSLDIREKCHGQP